jgi:hypothetical protein
MSRRWMLRTGLGVVLAFGFGASSGVSAETTSTTTTTSGVATTTSPTTVTAYPPPPSNPPSPVAVVPTGTTSTPACSSCPTNWASSTSAPTTANSHNPVAYDSSGTLIDTYTGRPAYFGPDGQAAWGGPQPGTEPYVMPDGRVAYYIPISSPPPVYFSPATAWPVTTTVPVAIVPAPPPIVVNPT